MSVILDALRKLDREKSLRRTAAPNIDAEILAPGPPRRGKRVALYLAGVCIVTAAATYTVLMGFDVRQKPFLPSAGNPPVTKEPAGPNLPVAPTAPIPPSPPAVQSLSAPSQALTLRKGFPPVSPIPRPTGNEVRPPESSPAPESLPSPQAALPAATQPAPVHAPAREEIGVHREGSEGIVVKTPLAAESAPPPSPEGDKKPVKPVSAEPGPAVPSAIERPLRAEPPEPPANPVSLRLSGIVWSEDPSQRVAVINGMPLSEGDSIEGVKVVQILPTRVRFLHNTSPFEVLLGSTTAIK